MSPEDILKTEWSNEFIQLQKNRILVSYHKYGPIKHNFGDKLVDAIGSMEKCIAKYKITGNTEYLVDAANYAQFEFRYPQHAKGHFRATSSDESAGIVGISINELKSFEEFD